jgi:hypothetical protein
MASSAEGTSGNGTLLTKFPTNLRRTTKFFNMHLVFCLKQCRAKTGSRPIWVMDWYVYMSGLRSYTPTYYSDLRMASVFITLECFVSLLLNCEKQFQLCREY